MTDSTPEPLLDPDEAELDHDDDIHDPGASPDDAGIPDVADDSSPGSGDVPESQRASMPTEVPVESTAHGMTATEETEGASLEERLEAEEPELDTGEPRSTDANGPMHIEEEPMPMEEEPP